MNKLSRLTIDALLLIMFLSLLVMPMSSIGLSTYKTSDLQVLGTEDVVEDADDVLEDQTRRYYQIREVPSTVQTTQTTQTTVVDR